MTRPPLPFCSGAAAARVDRPPGSATMRFSAQSAAASTAPSRPATGDASRKSDVVAAEEKGKGGRVTIISRIEPFEACSGFTRVAAGRIAQPPTSAFVARLQPGRSPSQTARQLPDSSTLIRVEPSSTRETRRQGAHGGTQLRKRGRKPKSDVVAAEEKGKDGRVAVIRNSVIDAVKDHVYKRAAAL